MTTVYATRVTDYFAARVAAYQADASGAVPRVDFGSGTLVVGDGGGATPTLSAMLAAGGVTQEVWRGATIGSVSVDPDNPRQIDIECVIPAAIGGVEIGGWTVREFAVLDETGALCVYGTTNLEKTTSAQGQISDLAWIAAVVVSAAEAVVLTPPGAGFVSMRQVTDAINASHPKADDPLYYSDTTDSLGWLRRVFKIKAATSSQIGYGRVATDAEFAAGSADDAAPYKFPWPSLAQIKTALAAITLGSGKGVAINAKKLDLDYSTLSADAAVASGDLLARMKPASGTTPASHVTMTVEAFLSLVKSKTPPRKPRATYSVAGLYTFTAPEEGWYFVRLQGAGGGGSGGNGASGWSGGGGGSGGYAERWVYLLAGQSVNVRVGAGGAGSAPETAGQGATGGETKFGDSEAGVAFRATGGGGGQGSSTTCAGGVPGQGFDGDLNLYGAVGNTGVPGHPELPGGVGGASAFGGGGQSSTITEPATAFAPGAGGGGIWGSGYIPQWGGRGHDGLVVIA